MQPNFNISKKPLFNNGTLGQITHLGMPLRAASPLWVWIAEQQTISRLSRPGSNSLPTPIRNLGGGINFPSFFNFFLFIFHQNPFFPLLLRKDGSAENRLCQPSNQDVFSFSQGCLGILQALLSIGYSRHLLLVHWVSVCCLFIWATAV